MYNFKLIIKNIPYMTEEEKEILLKNFMKFVVRYIKISYILAVIHDKMLRKYVFIL